MMVMMMCDPVKLVVSSQPFVPDHLGSNLALFIGFNCSTEFFYQSSFLRHPDGAFQHIVRRQTSQVKLEVALNRNLSFGDH